ncbi:hypothetical protein [Mesorhizobium sp. Root172]|jgi:hypothetical protein|uniref:hypothetical protein n=1 Tax=Mesorhizobium sp. Root172 TaxID=1736481 RepID=UPI002A4E1E7E|nr:hypothetical protein [Mesorhizobium sp. Root172]
MWAATRRLWEGENIESGGNGTALSVLTEMMSDPNHLRIDDPGKVEGIVVFTYLDAFDEDPDALENTKAHYRRGGLGDHKIKRRLEDILQALIGPIRDRRANWLRSGFEMLRPSLNAVTVAAVAATIADIRPRDGWPRR